MKEDKEEFQKLIDVDIEPIFQSNLFDNDASRSIPDRVEYIDLERQEDDNDFRRKEKNAKRLLSRKMFKILQKKQKMNQFEIERYSKDSENTSNYINAIPYRQKSEQALIQAVMTLIANQRNTQENAPTYTPTNIPAERKNLTEQQKQFIDKLLVEYPNIKVPQLMEIFEIPKCLQRNVRYQWEKNIKKRNN